MIQLMIGIVVLGVLVRSIGFGVAGSVAATQLGRHELVANEVALSRLAELRAGEVPLAGGEFEVARGLLPQGRGRVRISQREPGLASVAIAISWRVGDSPERTAVVESLIAEERR